MNRAQRIAAFLPAILVSAGAYAVTAERPAIADPSPKIAMSMTETIPAPAGPRDAALIAIAERELDRLGDAIPNRDFVGIADFGLHASEPRFYLIDMESRTVEAFRTTHGTGSDQDNDGWVEAYSNVEGSLATSRGAYRTKSWYEGKYGTSMRLDGLDETNSNALDRAIVLHPAEYASPGHVKRYGRVGRSWGCLAFAPNDLQPALSKLVDGRLIYVETLGIQADGTRNGRRAGNLVPLETGDPAKDQLFRGVF